MPRTWLDDAEAEAAELFGGGESPDAPLEEENGDFEGFASEGYDDTEAFRLRRRRRRAPRAQELALAQRRAALARQIYRDITTRPGYSPAGALARRIQAEVAQLGVETKVQEDALARVLLAQRKRIRATETAASFSAVVPSAQALFESLGTSAAANRVAKAALPFASLLFLRPMSRFLADPRVWAAAAAAGLVGLEHMRSRDREARDIDITGKPELPVGTTSIVLADVLDGKGFVVPGMIPRWESSDETKVKVTVSDKGEATILATGNPGDMVILSAKADGVVKRIPITLVA